MTSVSDFIGRYPRCILVEIISAKGSTPRDAGSFMLVSPDAIWGTIGGGQFEYIAIENARRLIAGNGGDPMMDIPLGPEIGQCCGGRTLVGFQAVTSAVTASLAERIAAETACLPQVRVFGAGHVGLALVDAMRLLPVALSVVETRRDEFDALPQNIEAHLTPMPESLIADLDPGSAVVILTHDHALDFLLAREALQRDDLSYVGMIGSATKRASFASWLMREEGGDRNWVDRLVLPIGGTAVRDKRPAVIAAMTAAEVLTALHLYRQRSSS